MGGEPKVCENGEMFVCVRTCISGQSRSCQETLLPSSLLVSSSPSPLRPSPLLLVSPADWQEVSAEPIPGRPRRELLSTSNMDSLNTEGKAVACRGHKESLNQELTNSAVDVAAMVQGS